MPDEAKKIFRERLARRFAHLNNHLANNDYLMGKDFSVADAYLFARYRTGRPGWTSTLAPFANVLAYRKRVGARPTGAGGAQGRGLTVGTVECIPGFMPGDQLQQSQRVP